MIFFECIFQRFEFNSPNIVFAEYFAMGGFVQFTKKGISFEEGDDSTSNYGFSEEGLQDIRELAPGNINGEIKELYLYVFFLFISKELLQ